MSESVTKKEVLKTVAFCVVVLLATALVSFCASAQDIEDCDYIQDTSLYLECVGSPEFTENYLLPPDTDTVKEDYKEASEEEAIYDNVQENLDAE